MIYRCICHFREFLLKSPSNVKCARIILYKNIPLTIQNASPQTTKPHLFLHRRNFLYAKINVNFPYFDITGSFVPGNVDKVLSLHVTRRLKNWLKQIKYEYKQLKKFCITIASPITIKVLYQNRVKNKISKLSYDSIKSDKKNYNKNI